MSGAPGAAELRQIERYRFEATFPGSPFGPWVVDEPVPTGGDAGPNPARVLASAVGHCLSSTLFNTLERAKVAAAPIHASVDVEIGRNPEGRLRVRSMQVRIITHPLREDDRARFDHCLEIFEQFCTVSGAVGEGIPITVRTGPDPA